MNSAFTAHIFPLTSCHVLCFGLLCCDSSLVFSPVLSLVYFLIASTCSLFSSWVICLFITSCVFVSFIVSLSSCSCLIQFADSCLCSYLEHSHPWLVAVCLCSDLWLLMPITGFTLRNHTLSIHTCVWSITLYITLKHDYERGFNDWSWADTG